MDLVWTKQVDTLLEAQKIFEKFLAEGQEGTILKSKTGIWEDRRSKDQVKFKGELECDLVVVDWEEGTGKNKGRLGALVCETSDGVIRVNVGSGYSDEQRAEFDKKVIGKIITVRYNARIKERSGASESLFLPRFIELREDKNTAEASKSVK
jgi:ATP-dependent DNA ligase